MNGTFAMADSLVNDIVVSAQMLKCVDVVVCPPYVYLSTVAEKLIDAPCVSLGSQNCSEHSCGAYTGEVSSAMLKEVGCDYIICGHSERRQYHSESNNVVAEKAIAAIEQQLFPIVCVGETLEERQSGMMQSVVEQQLDSILERCAGDLAEKLTIAYEPVWAIGSGRSATPEQAQAMHCLIRQRLASVSERAAEYGRVLYGGSVTDENVASFFRQPDIDGCLVGGASLKSKQFIEICKAAQGG